MRIHRVLSDLEEFSESLDSAELDRRAVPALEVDIPDSTPGKEN
jgi:hypothetical protein